MSADTAIIEFIKTPYIQEYQWHSDSLLIWVADCDWQPFKLVLSKLCNFEDGGIPARIQDDYIYIDLSETELLSDYFEELRAGFPEI